MPCPEPDSWSDLADPARRDVLEQHLDTCSDCRELVAAIAKLGPSETMTAPELAGPGARIGRYVVERPLGAGGMGVVLAAYDSRLERTVALKLVRILDRSPEAIERARGRLVAEAKAMARVQHPNVVAVHEVVEDGHELFIAMERVDGTDLATWLAEAPRPLADRLRVVLDTGRGLTAAHEAGIVHRDVKPANILVDRSGHARLTDLGLAAAVADLDAPLAGLGRGSESRLVGTPGYIAPEVAAGARGDARADQYAFAITAEQVLGCSRRPRGRMARVLRRGRATRPEDRYPDVRTLVAELARANRARWPAAVIAGALAAAALAGGFAVSRDRVASCANDPSAGGTWTWMRRDLLSGALGANDASPAHQVTTNALALVDDRAQAWSAAVVDVCRARDRGTSVGEARGACLEDQRRELDATLGALLGTTATRALAAVAHLPAAAACTGAAPAVDDAEHRRVVAELRAIAALSAAGKYSDARTRADALAKTVTDPGLAARVAYRRADFTSRAGDDAAALPIAHQAVELAERAHDDAARIVAMRVTISILDDLGRVNETRELLPLLEAAATRQPLDDAERARTENTLGNAAVTAGDYVAAERHYRAELAAEQRTYANHPAPEIAGAFENLGSVVHNQGRVDESRALYDQSIAMFEATVGPDHPDIALPLTGLGAIENEAGNHDRAATYFERVIQIRTKALGPEHPYVSEALEQLARVERDRHHDDRAMELYRRAMGIAERGLGPDHPLTAVAQGHLAELLDARGNRAEARTLVEAAVATWESTGASLPDADDARFLLAKLAYADGSHARARKLADVARVHYAALPTPWDSTATEIATWLAAHP